MKINYSNIKRLADIILATLLIFPVGAFLLVYYFIGKRYFGSIFFFQERIGFNDKPFNIIKLKTMRSPDNLESRGMLGKFLRKFSIDELPQIFNVLKGDMSFVGPRPLLTEYLPLYSPLQRKRHQVKPGVTGLAQVMGRNTISWTQKLAFDIKYVENQSFLLDLKILFKTFFKIFQVSTVDASREATMDKFNGIN